MASTTPALPITRVNGTKFQVGSETVPGRVYDVELDDEAGYRCSCEAGQRGQLCKHVRLALAQNQEQQGELLPGEKGNPVPRKSRLDKLGYQFDEVASALQKEIRRGDEEAAVWWALLLYEASPFYAWKRVLVTAAEDVGLADRETVAMVCALGQAWAQCKERSYYVSAHHLTMAVVALCRAEKSTEVEDLQSLTLERQNRGEKREMPSYAVDVHTKRGRAAGATNADWYADRAQFGIPANRWTELAEKLTR